MLNLDGRTTFLQTEQRCLEIKPGFSKETPLVFRGAGHQAVSRECSDLIFKIVESGHHQYTRKGNDLFYLLDVSLIQALDSQNIELDTLDNRHLRIPID